MGTKAKQGESTTVVGEQPSSAKSDLGIYVGGGAKRQHRLLSPKKVGATVLLIVLLVAAAAMVLTHNNQKNEPAKEASKPFVAFPKTADSDAQDIISGYLNQADHTPANLQATVDKLTSLAQGGKTPQDKEAYSLAVVQLYMQAGNDSMALASAIQANDTFKTATTAAQLAGVYEAQKDYANAAEYYKQAVSRSPKTPVGERSAYNDYLREQKQMEAKL